MNVDLFLDTNILVYAATCDEHQTLKKGRALDIICSESFALSAQVIQEFYVVVTRKLGTPLSSVQALEWIDQLSEFPCVSVDSSLVKTGAKLSDRYKMSYWDGAIIAAAQIAGATRLHSEDLNHGQKYGTVMVENPFLDLPR